jgi:hypothetical protein
MGVNKASQGWNPLAHAKLELSKASQAVQKFFSDAIKPLPTNAATPPKKQMVNGARRSLPGGAASKQEHAASSVAQSPHGKAEATLKYASGKTGVNPKNVKKEVFGPASPTLSDAKQRVATFSKFYDKEAQGKAGVQKAMDGLRKAFNEGYGDDMFKNNGKTAKQLDDVSAQIKSGRLTKAQGDSASARILSKFERERARVTMAQGRNAEFGKGAQAAGRAVTVAGSAIGGTIVAGPAGGIGAAMLAGSAYDAATRMDQGSKRFSAQFDVSNSLGGLAASKIKGKNVNGGDLARAIAGTGMDALNGAFAGSGMVRSQAAQAAVKLAAKEAGAKVTVTQLAKAAAISNMKTTLVQSGATTGAQTLITAGDRSLTPAQKADKVGKHLTQTGKQLIPNVLFSGAGSFAGVKLQVPNKLADVTAQYGMDVASKTAQKSLENVIAGKGPGLNAEDWGGVLTQGAGGAVQNIANRGGKDTPTQQTTGQQSTTQQPRVVSPTLRAQTTSSQPASPGSNAPAPSSPAKSNGVTTLASQTNTTPNEKPATLLHIEKTQASVDAANRMQQNPYLPGESFGDAQRRMGAAFSAKDFNEGSTTPRISQDPPGMESQASVSTPPVKKTGGEQVKQSNPNSPSLNAANRLQKNPYQPDESFADARQRMGTAFNARDYNEGSNTLRVSQDPPGAELGDATRSTAGFASGSPLRLANSKKGWEVANTPRMNSLLKDFPGIFEIAKQVEKTVETYGSSNWTKGQAQSFEVDQGSVNAGVRSKEMPLSAEVEFVGRGAQSAVFKVALHNRATDARHVVALKVQHSPYYQRDATVPFPKVMKAIESLKQNSIVSKIMIDDQIEFTPFYFGMASKKQASGLPKGWSKSIQFGKYEDPNTIDSVYRKGAIDRLSPENIKALNASLIKKGRFPHRPDSRVTAFIDVANQVLDQARIGGNPGNGLAIDSIGENIFRKKDGRTVIVDPFENIVDDDFE